MKSILELLHTAETRAGERCSRGARYVTTLCNFEFALRPCGRYRRRVDVINVGRVLDVGVKRRIVARRQRLFQCKR